MEDNKIHVWFTFIDEVRDSQLIDEYKKMMPADDLSRMEKYYHQRHRIRFLTGRALVRTVLSTYTGIDPERLIFSRTALGRPYLQNDNVNDRLQFSISYSEGIVAFALVSDGDIGIDVEYETADINCREIAEHHFSAVEFQQLSRLPEDQLKTRFFQYWTLKESYIKARGYGMTIALDSFSILFPQTGGDQISIMPLAEESGRDRTHWHFKTMLPGPRYQGALALRSESEERFQISTKKSVPLVYEHDFHCS